MNTPSQSAGIPTVISSTAETGTDTSVVSAPSRALRDGRITMVALIDAYMASYAGRDPSRPQRLAWWADKLGHVSLGDLTDDLIAGALEDLAAQRGRYWAGMDAYGKRSSRQKKRLFGSERQSLRAALAAVLTWSIKKRIAPPGWVSPMSGIERRPESRGRVRFLSDKERDLLLNECKRSAWKKLFALVLLALSTGAPEGRTRRTGWCDIDLDRCIATIHRTKNDDPRLLPLVPAVVDELKKHVGTPSALVFDPDADQTAPTTASRRGTRCSRMLAYATLSSTI